MMRPSALALMSTIFFMACRNDADVVLTTAPPELVEVSLAESGGRLSFSLPDAGWRRVGEEGTPRGFVFEKDGRNLQVEFVLKEDLFSSAVAQARRRHEGAEIRAFQIGAVWPFVGVIVAYRGPPDAPMLDAFVRSFRFERR